MGILKTDQVYIKDAPTVQKHGVSKEFLEGSGWASTTGYKYEFRRDNGIAISQTNIAIYEAKGLFPSIILPSDGQIIKSFMRVTSPRTAGTLTLKIRKTTPPGSPTIIVPGGDSLDIVINGTDDEYVFASVDPENSDYTVSEGDIIEVVLTSDGSWAPVTASIEAILFILLESKI